MKKNSWQKYLSLLLSFVIVFNITMIPVFAEGENTGETETQEEQAVSDEAETEESQDEQTEAEEGQDDQGELASEEPAEEQAEDDQTEAEEPAEEQEEDAEPEEHVGGEGKYVKDVYIAYAKTEEEAKAWLRKNKWEPLTGNADFNAGKASKFDDDVAAVMGIRRTDKKEEAITDMAVMNMKGGYSFPDYQTLLKEKKGEINEFINTFIPVLEEYRDNYNGKGSDAGKQRAKLAYDFLNRFYDGGKDDPYAVNDTGKPLGELFLSKVKQEDGGKDAGDLEQIMLESSGAAVTAVEVSLALAADTGNETWIERLSELSGEDLSKNLEKYVPEAKGQDVAPSAVTKFLKQHFGDQAKSLANQWNDVHDRMIWLEEYNENNDLWQHDGESDEKYAERLSKFFDKQDKNSETGMSSEHTDYLRAYTLYNGLYETPYEGEWGETLGDFFNPAESEYGYSVEQFLPFAAALSEGQRAAVDLVSLETLLMLGMGTEESVKDLFPQAKEVFGDAESISVYSGMNRGIFRGGVALTNAALMEKNQNGADPFADMWSFSGIYNIAVYAAAVTGIATIGAGFAYLKHIKGSESYRMVLRDLAQRENDILGQKVVVSDAKDVWDAAVSQKSGYVITAKEDYIAENNKLLEQQSQLKEAKAGASKMTASARVVMGIGGALLVGAAVAKGYQLYRYYQKTFTQIPTYIVDEADIVSYEKDDEGNDTKLIQFDQFVYYASVRCNRQEVGEISDWQDGVESYASWGCGDAADLNGDFGQEWLALYTVKSSRKGDPILADSLKLQYGSSKMPEGTSKALHMFTYENATDLGDTAYSFNNDKNGVYFFWDVDEGAFDDKGAASSFGGGSAAVAGGIGLLVGIIGTAFVMKRRKKNNNI